MAAVEFELSKFSIIRNFGQSFRFWSFERKPEETLISYVCYDP